MCYLVVASYIAHAAVGARVGGGEPLRAVVARYDDASQLDRFDDVEALVVALHDASHEAARLIPARLEVDAALVDGERKCTTSCT